MADVIIQRITVEGGKDIEAALKSIGKTGEAAFNQVNDAANKASSGSKAGKVFGDLAAEVRGAGAAAAVTGQQFSGLSGIFAAVSKAIGGIGGGARGAAGGLNGLNDASDQAGGSMNNANSAAVRFGQSIRLIGRAARIPELSQLGRTVGVLGRAFAIAAPALFVAALAKLASSAATAADAFADLAAKNKVSLEDFGKVSTAFTGIGQGADEAGKTFGALSNVIKETATNTEHNEANFRRLSDQLVEARNKAGDLAVGFIAIDRESTRALRDIRSEQQALSRSQTNDARDFVTSLRKIQEQRDDITRGTALSKDEQQARQLRDLDEQEAKLRQDQIEKQKKATEEAVKLREKEADAIRKQQEETKKLIDQQVAEEKKIRETEKALADARAEADRNATALEKLGVKATDGAGKLRKVPAVLEDIANALSRVTDASKREQIENDLVAAGLERKLLPALRGGADAFKSLQADGKKINPPFTAADVKVADDFQIAMGRTGQALASLKNAFGLAVAPAFTAFFDKLTDIFVSLRPAIAQFGSALATVLKPVLEGIATAIGLVIDAFGALASGIASAINAVFGTNLKAADVFAGALLAVAVAFGGLPVAIGLAIAAVGKLIEQLNKISPTFGKIVSVGVAALAALGAAFALIIAPILRVFGLLASAIVPVARVFGAALPLITRFGGTLGTIISVVLRASAAIAAFSAGVLSIPVVIAAVIAAAAAFFAVWAFNNWDKITKFASDTWAAILQGATDLWTGVKALFNAGVSAVSNFFKTTIPNAASAAWNAVLTGAQVLWAAVINVFTVAIATVADFFTQTIPNAASAVWNAIAAGAVAAWEVISNAFQAGVSAIVNFFTVTIPEAAAAVWEGIVAGAVQLWTDVSAAFTAGVQTISDFFTKTIPAAAKSAWDFITQGATDLWTGVVALFQGGIDRLVAFFQRLKDFVVGVWQAITGAAQKAGAAQEEAGGGGGGTTSGFAGGGPVWGAGTSTSDSILARLSNGEFVQQAKAVRYYGRSVMDALNHMRIPRNMFRGFNMGGIVERLAVDFPSLPRFAEGGPVSTTAGGMHPVVIDLGGGQKIKGLRAPSSVIKELQHAAVSRQTASAGRKPSYYGKGS